MIPAEEEPLTKTNDMIMTRCDYPLPSDDDEKQERDDDNVKTHTSISFLSDHATTTTPPSAFSMDVPFTGKCDNNDKDLEHAEKVPRIDFLVHGFHDHCTLNVPSSVIRCGVRTTRIIANHNHQFLLELQEQQQNQQQQQHNQQQESSATPQYVVMIQRVADGNNHGAVQLLRFIYTLVAIFLLAILFVCSVQIMLFLVVNLAVALGITSNSDIHVGAAIGILLAIPSFMNALVNVLTIATYFVHDAWRGHVLIKQCFHPNYPILVEWVVCIVYVGFPVLVMGVTLLCPKLSSQGQWWEVTSLIWFYGMFLFLIMFILMISYHETRACWEIMTNRRQPNDNDSSSTTTSSNNSSSNMKNSFWQLVRQCLLIRQVHTYSGEERISYLVTRGNRLPAFSHEPCLVPNTRRVWKGLWTRVTLCSIVSTDQGCWGWMEHLVEPESVHAMDEPKTIRPYVTNTTWSLEKSSSSWCSCCGWPFHSRRLDAIVVQGPGAVSRAQQRSSLACTVFGDLLTTILITGILMRLNVTGVAIAIFLVVMVFFMLVRFKWNYGFYQAIRNLPLDKEEQELDDTGGDSNQANEEAYSDPKESVVIYQILERKRLTRPTTMFCWVMFIIEVGLFFLWPLSSLFRVGSAALGILFVVVVGISALRHYINASVLLEESTAGTMNLMNNLCKEDDDDDSMERWNNKSRLRKIVGGITYSRSRRVWASCLGLFVALFLGFCMASFSDKVFGSVNLEYTFLPDFLYEQNNDLAYPTCRMGKGLEALPTISMVDYCYLSNLAYRKQSITQSQLDGWFGANVAVDTQSMVDDFLNRTAVGSTLALSFKLISFPAHNFSMVAIRGTNNVSDLLTDSQLWSAAAFLQLTRALLPGGRTWTPLLGHLAGIMARMESKSISRVSFYQTTTLFVNELLATPGFGGVQLTGHSLGGGLAIITGAQTHVVAIALSAPNAKISRRTFDPPVTLDALNAYTFNIIPERDLVAMVDDRTDMFQQIKCRAPYNNLMACHDPTRSLCEVLYKCGTGNRPALCECVTQYGYPKPIAKGNRTFEEACACFDGT